MNLTKNIKNYYKTQRIIERYIHAEQQLSTIYMINKDKKIKKKLEDLSSKIQKLNLY